MDRNALNNIRVVILCGGIGKRLFPINTDKSLLKFNGSPLIIHQINKAKEAGLKKFIIVTNKFNAPFVKAVLSKSSGLQVDYVNQEKPEGMADALFSASRIIGNNPFILASSNDIVEGSAYSAILDSYLKNEVSYSVYMTAFKVQDYFPGGYLEVSSKGEVKSIIEKPPRGKEPSNLINIVLHLHTNPKMLFDYLKRTKSDTDDVYEKALFKMINEKCKIKAVTYKDKWQAIKFPWHILDTMDFLTANLGRNISKKAIVSKKAVIDGKVIIKDGVRILEGAVIRGPSYISENTVIGNNVLIRNSTIGTGTVIGFNTEIKHSYIGNNCWFHSNYIGDSVIDDNCSFGAGAITANFKLDEENVFVSFDDGKIDTGHDKLGAFLGQGARVGINASLMPGVRIGSNTFIIPNINLNRDVEPDQIVLEESKIIITRKLAKMTKYDKRQKLMENLVK